MIAADALAFALKHWRAIGGGLLLASLLSWALVERSGRVHWQKTAQANADAASLANQKLAISNASIDTLQTALADKNAESEARAKAYADAQAQDAATLADMDKRRKADASRIETLEGLAKNLPDDPNCKASSALIANLKGL